MHIRHLRLGNIANQWSWTHCIVRRTIGSLARMIAHLGGAGAAGENELVLDHLDHLPPHHVLELAWTQLALGVAQLAVVGDAREVGVGEVDARVEVLADRQAAGR